MSNDGVFGYSSYGYNSCMGDIHYFVAVDGVFPEYCLCGKMKRAGGSSGYPVENLPPMLELKSDPCEDEIRKLREDVAEMKDILKKLFKKVDSEEDDVL